MKEMGEHDPYPIMRHACAGTTVLIGVIIEHNIRVASHGDSEGCESIYLFYAVICNIFLHRFLSLVGLSRP